MDRALASRQDEIDEVHGGSVVSGQCNLAREAEYWTPHHIRAAVTATGVVLLDLKQNRYRALGESNARELAALAANWSDVSNQTEPLEAASRDEAARHAPAFVQAGLLSRDQPDVAFHTRHVDVHGLLTSIGLQEQRHASIRLHHVGTFVRACFWAKRALKSRTLYSLACEVSARKAAANSSVDVERTIELVCVFRKLRPFAFEAQDRCLFHALALVRFLARYESYPTWVIGVRPKPWGAHSWVQHENLILDGNPEDICSFTPILAV
jgi:hypothetical protein